METVKYTLMERKKHFSKEKMTSVDLRSQSKIMPSDFTIWFLIKLTERYDLYEYREDKKYRLLDKGAIEESAVLSDSEIVDRKEDYKFHKDEMSLEEFLDRVKVAFAKIYLFSKGASVDLSNFEKKNVLPVIELEFPDGELDQIWIANVTPEMNLLMKILVDEYNSNTPKSE